MKFKQLKETGGYISLALITIMLLASCTSDHFKMNPEESSTDKVGVELKMNLPKSMTRSDAGLYSLTPEQEQSVKTVDVLSFITNESGESELYSIDGSRNTTAPNQFLVTLVKSNEKQTHLVLANVADEVADLIKKQIIKQGVKKEVIVEALLSEKPGAWKAEIGNSKEFDPFPMSGEVVAAIEESTKSLTVEMLRSIARVDVSINPTIKDKFQLTHVYLYNSNSQGYIVHDEEKYKNHETNIYPSPILEKNSEALEYLVSAPYESLASEIYLYEANPEPEASEATALVVGGRYDGAGVSTYYRIDFADLEGQLYPLVRNHHYLVTIKEVLNKGHQSPKEAFDSQSFNLEVEIVKWDESKAGDIVFDKDHYLSFDPGSFIEFYRQADSAELNITTNYSGGFEITHCTNEDGSTIEPSGWLQAKQIDGQPNVRVEVQENDTQLDRIGYVHVAAGRIETTIEVSQIIKESLFLKLLNSKEDREISELVFASDPGTIPGSSDYIVHWSPFGLQGAEVSVLSNEVLGEHEFLSDDIPEVGYSISAHGQDGKWRGSIAPSTAITEAEIADNLFFERTNLLSFNWYTGYKYIKKGLVLKQMVPNIEIDGNEFYMLGTNRFTFNLKSNSPWKINRVTELNGDTELLNPTSLKVLENQHGEANTYGKEIAFITGSDAHSAGGTLQIECELSDPEAWQEPNLKFNRTFTLQIVGHYYKPEEPHLGWAGSNIYWDEERQIMTFDDVNSAGESPNSGKQGLYFKWGSLVGIGGGNQGSSFDSTIYLPDGGEPATSDWNSITYLRGSYDKHPGPVEEYNVLYTRTEVGKEYGDICRYLTLKGYAPGSVEGGKTGKRWRMPTQADFGKSNSDNIFNDFQKGTNSTQNNKFGTSTITSGRDIKDAKHPTFFPASGNRSGSGGNLNNLDNYGHYWISSASNSKIGVYFTETALRIDAGNRAENAQSIRCVLDKE